MKRRDFLLQGAAATTAVGAGSALLPGQAPGTADSAGPAMRGGAPAQECAPGNLIRNFEDCNPDGTYKYGLQFNDAGEITNGTDVFLRILADTPEGGTIRWQTAWLHTAPVRITQRVNLEGQISAPILVNMPDPANDIALLVKGPPTPSTFSTTTNGVTTTGPATSYNGPAYFTHRFVMLGGGNANGCDPATQPPVCKHGAMYFFCSKAQVIAHIRLPCTGWGLVSAGNLYCDFDLTMNTNFNYYNQNGTQIFTGMSYRGLWASPGGFQVNPADDEVVGSSGNNNTRFHLCFASANVLIEDNVAQSDVELSGAIEGGNAQCSGDSRTLFVSGTRGLHIHDLHYESNAGPLTLEHCIAPRLENVTLWGSTTEGMVLELDNCINASLENVQVDTLFISPDSQGTQVGSLVYGMLGRLGSGIMDYSPSTRFLGAPTPVQQATSGATGAGDGAGINLVPNGNFATPLAYTQVGTVPLTAVATTAAAALFRFPNAYQLTSTAASSTDLSAIQVEIPNVNQLGNPMVFTFWAWVKWAGPPPSTPQFGVAGIDSATGAQLTGGQLFSGAPGWVRIATWGMVSGVPSFVIGGYGPFDVYVGEIGATFGQTAPAGWVP